MKRVFLLTLMFAVMLSSAVVGETIRVDDHFDDGVVDTNTHGIGTGFNSQTWNGGTVAEANSRVTLSGPTNGGRQASITSREGASIGTGVARFEFLDVGFAQGNTSTGTTARNCVGVKGTNTAWNFDGGLPTGFWIQFENNSLLTSGTGSGGWNGTSVLFYRANDNTRTALATWTFNTLNWNTGTQNLTPRLDITLDLGPNGYDLTIAGDTITLLSGSLSNTYAAAGITNQLTTGFASAYVQSENPGINISMGRIIITEGVAAGPYSPEVLPVNVDGTVGDIHSETTTLTHVDVMLSWQAPPDPNSQTAYPVNPDVIGYNIYLSDDSQVILDELYAYVPQVHNVNPALTNPDNAYGPFSRDRGVTYYWQVEAVMDSGEVTNYPNTGGRGYPARDPGNLMGPLWSFITVSAAPKILTISDHQLIDAFGAAELTVVADESADNYRWFKVVGVQDTAGGESDDTPLTDGGMYLGTTTDTLSITGMSADGSDDARYYVIAYNQGIASVPSAVRWVWYPRLVSHYMFDLLSYYTNDQGSFIKDMISGYDAQLMSGNGSAVPYLAPDAPSGLGRVTSLPFNAGNQIYLQVNAPFAATFKDLTISMWFKTTGTAGTSSYQRLFDYGNGQGNSTFISPNYNGAGRAAFAVDVPDHGERNVQSALGLVQNNTWTHITATLSGTTARLFINGEWVNLSTDFPYPPVMNGATTQNYIGRSQYPDPYFNGNIADLKVWNYALTNEEVAREYLDGVPSKDYICDREEFRHFQSMDSNNNCIIDLEDLAELVGMWMDYQLFFAAD